MLFGISALFFVGVTWTLVGIVMGNAPKRGIDTSLIQFFGALVSFFVSSSVVLVQGGSECPSNVFWLTGGSLFAGGILNFCLLELMARAMKKGPNGIIWSIIQSALIFPFLVGVIFYAVPLSCARGIGILALIAALMLFGFGRNNEVHGTHWRLPALLAFLCAGIQQNLSSLPSYYLEAEAVNSITRTMFASSGVLFAAFSYNSVTMTREKFHFLFSNLRRKSLWGFVGILQGFSLFSSYLLFYPGMNALANADAGAISYPLMVGSCIVGFACYSRFILKEKSGKIQLFALLLCLAGIIGICIK